MSENKARVELNLLIASVGLLVASVSALAAIASICVASQANIKADRASQLAAEANRIALQQVEIALKDTSADVRAIRGTGADAIFVYGCHYESSARLGVYSATKAHVTFTNMGGRPVSLVDIDLSGGNRKWSETIYGQDEEVDLPIDIQSGVSRTWVFVATSMQTDTSEYSIRQIWTDVRHSAPVIEWAFFFGDGRTVRWEVQSWPSSPTAEPDFSRSCEEFAQKPW